MDINEIFKDLGMMIHEQGDMIGKPYGLDFMSVSKQATYNLPVVTSQTRVTVPSLPFGHSGIKSKVYNSQGITLGII